MSTALVTASTFIPPQIEGANFLNLMIIDDERAIREVCKEVAQSISDLSGLNLATVHLFLARRPAPSPTTTLSAAIVADQQRVADSFKEIGLIPKPVRVADIVWQPPGGLQEKKQVSSK